MVLIVAPPELVRLLQDTAGRHHQYNYARLRSFPMAAVSGWCAVRNMHAKVVAHER